MKTLVKTECSFCGGAVWKELSHYNYNKKHERKNFCSIVCLNAHRRKSQTDELSVWRTYHHALRHRRVLGGGKLVSLLDLREQWERQDGTCVYTNVKLEHQVLNRQRKGIVVDPNTTASVDRIDPTKGYVEGNIQFVSITANFAKRSLSHQQMVEFIRLVKSS